MDATKQAENAAKQAENASKKAQATTKSWTETQTKIFDKWFQTVKEAAAPTDIFEQVQQTTVDTYEASVRNALEAQAQLSRISVDAIAAFVPSAEKGADPAAIKQLRTMVDSWTDAQAEVWSSWFEVARKFDTSLWSDSWDKFTESVQQSVRKTAGNGSAAK